MSVAVGLLLVIAMALCGINSALHSLIDNGVTVSDAFQRD